MPYSLRVIQINLTVAHTHNNHTQDLIFTVHTYTNSLEVSITMCYNETFIAAQYPIKRGFLCTPGSATEAATKVGSLMDIVVSLPYESLALARQATLNEFFNIMIITCICITIIVIMGITC